MKSKLVKPYDITQVVVPDEMTKWRIPNSVIAKKLEELTHIHAVESSVECVEIGDSVKCVCADNTENVVLVYPGRMLKGAETVERALLGRKTDDEVNTFLHEKPIKLVIKEIRRRTTAPVNDQLVLAENIEGVSTIAEYYAWYRKQNEPIERQRAEYQIASLFFKVLAEGSSFEIDKEEQWQWAYNRADFFYRINMYASGIEMVRNEEAIMQSAKQQLPSFVYTLIDRYLCEQAGFIFGEKEFMDSTREYATHLGKALDEVLAVTNKEVTIDALYNNKAREFLSQTAAKYLEV